MKKIFLIALTLIFTITPINATDDYESAASVARVIISGQDESDTIYISISAIVLDEQTFLTTSSIEEDEIEDIYVIPDLIDEDSYVKAKITEIDKDLGLAVITTSKKIKDRYKPAKFMSSEKLETNDKITSFGYKTYNSQYSQWKKNTDSKINDVITNKGLIKANKCSSKLTFDCIKISENFDIDEEEGIGFLGGPIILDEKDLVIGMRNIDTEKNNFQAMINSSIITKFLDEHNISYSTNTSSFTNDNNLIYIIAAVILFGILGFSFFKRKKTSQTSTMPNSDTLIAQDIKIEPEIEKTTNIIVNNWYLKGISGNYQGMSIPIDNKINIGRNINKCNLIIENSNEISNLHCTISLLANKLYLIDQNSSNGTYLNSQKIKPLQELSIKENDLITLGKTDNTFIIIKE